MYIRGRQLHRYPSWLLLLHGDQFQLLPHLPRELKYASYAQHWRDDRCAWQRWLALVLGRPHYHQICQIPPDPESLEMEGKLCSREQLFAGTNPSRCVTVDLTGQK